MTARDIHTQIANEIRTAAAQLAEANLAVEADERLAQLQACSAAERAALWAGLNAGQRHQLAAAALRALGREVTTHDVLLWVEAMDRRWGPQPEGPASLADVEQAARAVDEELTRAAAWAPEAADRQQLLAQRNAARRALDEYRLGHRPEQLPNGAWRVTSASDRGRAYETTGGACSCTAGQHGLYCWHRATLLLVGRALQQRHASWANESARLLGARLASARRRIEVA